MEEVYILLTICSRKEGARKSEVFEAMKFFGINFQQKDWQRLMRLNKEEHGVYFLGGKWFCCDYFVRRCIYHTLSQESKGFNLPYSFRDNREKFRAYFSVSDFDFNLQ